MNLQGLIVPNEPRAIRNLLSDLVECPQGWDITLFTNSGKVGIERKKVPGDLLSSVDDGRLNREILALREECTVSIILLHGAIYYNKNDTVRLGKRTSYYWTRKGVTNLLRTIQYVEGCYLEQARNNFELVQVMHNLQEYFDRKEHLSIRGRSPIRSDWIKPIYTEKVRYWMDGLPGVGARGAMLLTERFSTPMSLFQASIEEIMEVPGIGRALATGIYSFLRGVK